MKQLIAHLVGDFVVQSHWMASAKTKSHGPAAVHAVTYTAGFLPLTRNPLRLAVIGGTHFVIDRWRLAKYLVWVKNQLVPAEYRYPWSQADETGNYHWQPAHVNFWLMVLADNTVHILINQLALRGSDANDN